MRIPIALAALIALLLPWSDASAAPCLQVPQVSDRCEDWAARGSIGWGEAVVADPENGRVYVAATALGPSGDTNGDVHLFAYEAATGSELWSLWRDGGVGGYDAANELTLADGRVCVSAGVQPGAGPVAGVPSGYDVAVICADAASGEVLWERTYDIPAGRDDTADGGMVRATVRMGDGSTRDLLLVGGFSGHAPLAGDPSEKDLLTMALDARNGDLVWESRYDGPAGKWEVGRGIGVSPDGRLVFVTGESSGNGTRHDYVTVAYEAATGDEVWVARYEGLGGDLADEPNALAVSPAGDLVVVTGSSEEARGELRWATVAYDASTGKQRWVARHAGVSPPGPVPGEVRPSTFFPAVNLTGNDDEAEALVFAPDGGTVYVTGYARAFPNATDYATVAYDSKNGTAVWDAAYDGPSHRHDGAADIAVSPTGDRIYVTGNSGSGTALEARYRHGPLLDDAATVAYDAEGGRQWVARYDGGPYVDTGDALAVTAGAVFVTGRAGWVDELGRNHVDPVTLRYAP